MTPLLMISVKELSPPSPRKKKGSLLHKYKESYTPKGMKRTIAIQQSPPKVLRIPNIDPGKGGAIIGVCKTSYVPTRA